MVSLEYAKYPIDDTLIRHYTNLKSINCDYTFVYLMCSWILSTLYKKYNWYRTNEIWRFNYTSLKMKIRRA